MASPVFTWKLELGTATVLACVDATSLARVDIIQGDDAKRVTLYLDHREALAVRDVFMDACTQLARVGD